MESEKEKSAEIEVTPEMIEAGYGILAKSGITDDLLEADREWVAEIYRAMRREQLRREKSCISSTIGDNRG